MPSKTDDEAKDLEVRIVRTPNTSLGHEISESTIWVPYNIGPDDFLFRITEILRVNRGTMKLGWRSCDDGQTSTPMPLRTTRHAMHLLNEMRFLKDAWKRRSIMKLFWVQVIDLVRELHHLFIA